MTTTDRMRSWNGPPLLSYGFRPFFLLAGIWSISAMMIWIGMLTGHLSVPMQFDPFSWHAHEFVFGYVSAVIAGFLLTAVPNWTGRLPVVGWPLAVLVLIWVAGRVALLWPLPISSLSVALIDLAFGIALIFFLGREIIVGKNWKNLPVLVILAILVVANALFHWDAQRNVSVSENIGLRTGIAAEIMLISLIGGRIIPSFTRNWLSQRGVKTMPASAGRFDLISLIINGLALVAFVVQPMSYITAALCVFAGYYNFVRLSRWQGHLTRSEPLVWVLHLAFICLVLGFVAVGIAAAGMMPMAGALHIWLVGTIGLMTIAVMTRATRGHTGRAVKAPKSTAAIYILILLSALARYAAAIGTSYATIGWTVAAASWIIAFGLFVAFYGPMLLRATQKSKPV